MSEPAATRAGRRAAESPRRSTSRIGRLPPPAGARALHVAGFRRACAGAGAGPARTAAIAARPTDARRATTRRNRSIRRGPGMDRLYALPPAGAPAWIGSVPRSTWRRVAPAGVEGCVDMPTRTTAARKRRRGKPRRRRFGAGVWLRLPILEQRDFDLIGLALVALGVFLACVLYLDWSGGELGAALTRGFGYLVGALVYGAPVALGIAGVLVIARPLLRSGRPFGAGAACLVCALTLAFAAGTLGLGPPGARSDVWDGDFVRAHGGVVGEALYTVADRAVQPLGAHILALFLFAAGVLLLTGATLAGVV